jgi:(S)-3,5-dihydroxyphenylglycine transaminase
MAEKDYTINHHLFGSYLDRMNFLNEISIDYPDAISFGSGRPDKRFFNVKDVVSCFFSIDGGDFNALGQYNKTNGIINESISMLLRNDEAIAALPGNIILTDGAQEGMAIVINTLFEPGSNHDVLLVSDPSYIGFVGYAKDIGDQYRSDPERREQHRPAASQRDRHSPEKEKKKSQGTL